VCVWCVCVSVGHVREPCENGWTDRDAVRWADSCEPKESCIGHRDAAFYQHSLTTCLLTETSCDPLGPTWHKQKTYSPVEQNETQPQQFDRCHGDGVARWRWNYATWVHSRGLSASFRQRLLTSQSASVCESLSPGVYHDFFLRYPVQGTEPSVRGPFFLITLNFFLIFVYCVLEATLPSLGHVNQYVLLLVLLLLLGSVCCIGQRRKKSGHLPLLVRKVPHFAR